MIAPESLEYQKMLVVLKQFRVVIASIKAHYREIEVSTGVSGAQLWALSAIALRPRITVGELARELALHASTASNLLVRLSELGYIRRERDITDQRVVAIQLTALGKRVARNAPQPAIGMLQAALLSLPQPRLAGLSDHLEELIRNIGSTRPTGAGTPLSTSLGGRKAAQ